VTRASGRLELFIFIPQKSQSRAISSAGNASRNAWQHSELRSRRMRVFADSNPVPHRGKADTTSRTRPSDPCSLAQQVDTGTVT
jgi:hypothetical protein